MNQETWTAVDDYVIETFGLEDDVLAGAQRACDDAGLPPIQVSAAQGKYLEMLARMTGARRVLEIGTLGGYSTICLARGLPAGGRVVTLEIDPKHAEVADGNFSRAGLSDMIDLRVGPALESLPVIQREGAGPFDLIFIDADKANIPSYFDWALQLSRPGSVIIVDNVVREGAVIDGSSTDEAVKGVRKFNSMAAELPGVQTTVLQTVGTKGYDGFAISLVLHR
jgi:predicted O-methyltransferase YrrM